MSISALVMWLMSTFITGAGGYARTMRFLKDDHTVEIDGHTVAVTGTTGRVHATWTLLIDGEPADTAKAAGDFMLRGTLADGSPSRPPCTRASSGRPRS